MRKIVKLVAMIIVPLILYLIVALKSYKYEYGGYINFSLQYLLLGYYLIGSLIFQEKKKNKKRQSIYDWLDESLEPEALLQQLFITKKSDQLQINLQFVYKKLNYYTGYDLLKLRLLKAYLHNINSENPRELLSKTFLAIITSIIIWLLSRGTIWGWISNYSKDAFSELNYYYVSVHHFIMIILYLMFFYSKIIKEHFVDKKRLSLIIEILDVCIKQGEDLEKRAEKK